MVTTRVCLLNTSFALAVLAVQPVFASDKTANESVVVVRGSHVQVQGGSTQAAKATKLPANSPQSDQNVAVLRPVPGSFMRETTKLAAAAQAREEQAARETALATNRQIAEALESVEEAAEAASEQSNKRRVIVTLQGGVASDSATGQRYRGGQRRVYVPVNDPNNR
jgi:preprotein translocase subunit SecD